jgi:hypothetical protein
MIAKSICLVLIVSSFCWSQSVSEWVATDGLGRTIPLPEEVGPAKSDRIVGMFYYVWQGHHGNRVYDITQIMKQYPSDPLSPLNPGWGPWNSFHWWGESEYGHFRAQDPWVIRKDMVMLANAGVDFLFLDFTNAVTYWPEVDSLCSVLTELKSTGIKVPTLSFMTNSNSGQTMNSLYDNFYAPGKCQEHWFSWQGKPLILGKSDDPNLRSEVRNYFTIRYSWAVTATTTNPHHWQWLDATPQRWGWDSDPAIKEQVSVSAAFHPENPHGQSYNNRIQPPVNADYRTEFTGQGLFFSEQWQRALELDPQVIMVTQWNEWLAQRFEWDGRRANYGGRPTQTGHSFFVDVLSQEFTRDLAPMKGGHTDNNYYLLVQNIRRFKGLPPRTPASAAQTIQVDGVFTDWNNVLPEYWDPTGDTKHRRFPGYDNRDTLVNSTGRNDIVEARVAHSPSTLGFYVRTNENLTSSTGQRWMMLFLDSDRNKATGWQGFDYRFNRIILANSRGVLEQSQGGQWVPIDTLNFAFNGKQLEVNIPRERLGMTTSALDFEFQWADNIQSDIEISSFFTDGDVAPDRRFRYLFQTESPYEINQNAWDFSAGLAGWSGLKNLSAASGTGCTELTLIGNDPFLRSPQPLMINANSLNHLIVTFKNQTGDASAQLYWTTEASPNFSESKSITFAIGTGSQTQTQVIDLSQNSNWQGTVTEIRFDPAATASAGSVCLESLKITGAYQSQIGIFPGKLEFENYNLGGLNNAYYDSNPQNQGGVYRTLQGVDIQATQDLDGGFNIGWLANGEWLEYLVFVQEPGEYQLDFRYAASTSGNQLKYHFSKNHSNATFTVNQTGGVQIWQNHSENAYLEQGLQLLRIEVINSGGGFNLNHLTVIRNAPVSLISQKAKVYSGSADLYNMLGKRMGRVQIQNGSILQKKDAGAEVGIYYLRLPNGEAMKIKFDKSQGN